MQLLQRIRHALSTVYDPDLKKDLVSLGMIDQLLVKDKTISFTIILTTPACPLQEILKQACIEAIRKELAAVDVDIVITTTAKVTSNRPAAAILPNVKNIIVVASGKGGVGKSTVATHLAFALASHGAQVGLLDADIFGPSIPIMWNCVGEKAHSLEQAGKKWIKPVTKHQVKLLSIGFLTQEAIIWRGPMASAALKQLIQDTEWGILDYLFIDLPPGTSDIHLTLAQTLLVTGAVIVTTPQKVALLDAIKAIAMFRKEQIKIPLLGLIENMSYFAPEQASDRPLHYIFGQGGGKGLAEQESIPFLGQIPLLPIICQQGDHGIDPSQMIPPFATIAQRLAQRVSINNQ